jgi:ATP-binding cassette subfamily C protein
MKTRSGFKVMLGLIGMVKPLLARMCLAILMGCAGNLMATFITVLGAFGLLAVTGLDNIHMGVVFSLLALFAVLRGILRYAEQASNHYIAFKLLADIRHQVFASLRRLAPAKLDGNDKGNLISIITTDIELLEVFYAHTISPIAIAVITSLFMCVFLGRYHWTFGVLAACFYLIVGFVIPMVNGHLGNGKGQEYRREYGKLNTAVLDNLYGLDEILQFNAQKNRVDVMNNHTETLENVNLKLKNQEAWQRLVTDSVILIAGVGMLILGLHMYNAGNVDVNAVIISTVSMLSSFGPVSALSALSNNLTQTLASGNRVLNLLEEEPVIEEISDGKKCESGNIAVKNVSFTYHDENSGTREVLSDFNADFGSNRIYGILGRSGCGKSTLLKLLMRFYETDKGAVSYNGTNVNEIQTASLRRHISYVTQETFLFEDTIENNIKVAKETATRQEVEEAAKKAAIHDFIVSLPNGYDTRLAELGDSISGGERQRIGIARAFLHDAPVILLDEPTSNIDSLNESIILKSLYEEKKDKQVILVSHRKSTMAIADEVIEFQ